MGTFGKTTPSSGLVDIGNNFETVSKYNLSVGADVTKLFFYVDGNGSGTGANEVIKGILYDDDGASGKPGTLLGTTAEITITDGQSAGWVEGAFASPITLASGDYWIGFHGGATAGVARFGSDQPATSNRIYVNQNYTLGPLATWTGGTVDNYQIDAYGLTDTGQVLPPAEDVVDVITGLAADTDLLANERASDTSELVGLPELPGPAGRPKVQIGTTRSIVDGWGL